MKKFQYEGKTRMGEVRTGEIEADSRTAAVSALRKQNLFPTKVKEVSSGGFNFNITLGTPRVEEKSVVVFTRQLATMIDAGLPLVQCLDILASQEDNPTFKKVVFQVKSDVEKGKTFAEALSEHPKIFDHLFTNLVTAAEIGGLLDVILNRLAQYKEKAMKLKKQVKGAMVYPASIIGVSIIVVAVLLIFVIPTFQQMFADFGAQLPAPTLLVVNVSEFLRGNILFIIAGIIGFVFLSKRVYRTRRGREIIDAASLKLPIFGDLLQKVAIARFTSTLGTLVGSGVPILDGLSITARAAGNKVIEDAIMATRTSISEGKTIAAPLEESKVFPPMVVQMIAVGESTGSLDLMLSKIADFYEDEVDATVAALTSLLEPILMVGLGLVIGGLLICMYLPIFEMASVIGD